MPPQSPFGIVVAVDRSTASEDAVRWAAAEARIHRTNLTLAHVVTPVSFDIQDARLRRRIQRWLDHRGRQLLADMTALLVADGVLPADRIHVEMRFDDVVDRLAGLSAHADMLVVGSRFYGSIGGRRLGSVSAAACSTAACPVAVVHRYDESDVGKPVLLGIDGSPASERATAIAFDEASRRHVGVIAVHAWSDVGVFPLLGMDWRTYRDEAEEVLAERLAGWQERYPDVGVDRRVYCDVPAHHLEREARHAGLVVLGSHGRGRVATLLLGSVATAVAENVDVPVVIARTNE